MKKKGQTTSGVAALVLVIGLFVVAYVLFLPPEERHALLGDNISKTSVSDGVEGVKILLIENPGRLKPVATSEIKHEISPVNLFVKIEPKIETLANRVVISRSLFSRSFPSISFQIEDLSDLEKASLFFSVSDPKGKLVIELNRNKFYEEEIDSTDLKIVNLPVGLIGKNNEIKFSVSSPGAAFWSTNHYILKDISIKQEFEKVNSKETRLFSVSNKEKRDMKNSKLEYFMYCNTLDGDYAQLRIYLNNKNLFTGLVRCAGTSNSIEVNIQNIKEGSNELIFVIDQGDFLFSNIKLVTNLKEVSFPTYHFALTSDEIQDVEDDERDVILNIELDSDGKAKRAVMAVNNKEVLVDTKSDSFSRDISSLVNEGDNLIKIIPSNEFDLNVLTIKLE